MTLRHTDGRQIEDLRDRAQLTKLYNKILNNYEINSWAMASHHDYETAKDAIEHAVMKTYEYLLHKQFRDSLVVTARTVSEMQEETISDKSRDKT